MGAEALAERGGVFSEEEGGLGCRGGDPERLAGPADPARAPLGDPPHECRHAGGGVRLAAEFISPLDLVGVGLVAAAEATHWLLHRPTRSD
jgi:hypothetical protein